MTHAAKPRAWPAVVAYMVAHCLAALLYLGVIEGELARHPAVREAFWELLADARYGFAETEEALFIVRRDDGSLGFLRWPSMHALRQAQWSLPIPPGVVAIVHTHPNWRPHPSRNDVRTALQSSIPIYVVTRDRVMKTVLGETLVVWKGDWRLPG